jgi:hypothetical protein
MWGTVAKGTTVLAIGATGIFVGSTIPTPGSSGGVAGAEVVAARFVTGFEEFSPRDEVPVAVADLATPRFAKMLSSPSQAATGPALAAERFTVSATVASFEVESDTSTSAELLARTEVHTSTSTGSSSAVRLVPVSVIRTTNGWRVSGIGGLTLPTSRSRTSRRTTPAAGTARSQAPIETAIDTGQVAAVGDVPGDYVAWMEAAVTAECPGLPWTVLAGIARVESDFGESTLPGVSSGSNSAGAEGPMQFEPATFAAYGTVAPGGADPASPYDSSDAIYSAARLLCADGGGNPAYLETAIFDYNHSDAYVSLVLAYANGYEQDIPGGAAIADNSAGLDDSTQERGLGSVIVADAESYLGTPYVWGGENPRTGFDCSGLVQWVYAEAGISLPRVAQDQYDFGPHLASSAPLDPGDLVFFGSGPSGVEHVGIYVGNGEMVDAPYTGVDVRFDHVASVTPAYVGATRPEIPNLTTGAGVPIFASYTSPSAAAPGSSATKAIETADRQQPRSPNGHRTATTSAPRPAGGRHRTTRTTAPVVTTTSAPKHVRRHPPPVATTTTTTTPTTTVPIATTTTTAPVRRHPTPTTTTTPPTTPPTTTTPPPTTIPTPASNSSTSTAGSSATTTPSAPPVHHPKSH